MTNSSRKYENVRKSMTVMARVRPLEIMYFPWVRVLWLYECGKGVVRANGHIHANGHIPWKTSIFHIKIWKTKTL